MKKLILVLLMLSLLAGCDKKDTSVSEGNTGIQDISVTPSTEPLAPTITSIANNPKEAVSPTLIPVTEEDRLFRLSMTSMDSGFALTENNHILKTTDGGLTWTDIYLIKKSDMMTGIYPVIEAVDDKTLFIAARYDNRTNIIKTSDGGDTWSYATIKSELKWVNDDIGDYEMDFIDVNNGYLLIDCTPGAGQMFKALFKTNDGGVNWSMVGGDIGCDDTVTGIPPSGISGYPSNISFTSIDSGWIMGGSNGAFPYGLFMNKTNDGGKTWSIMDYPMLPKEYSEMDGADIYISASKPCFYGKNNSKGKMCMGFHQYGAFDKDTAYMYTLADDGTWSLEGKCDTIVYDYKFIDDNKGIGLDTERNFCITEDGGLTWSRK